MDDQESAELKKAAEDFRDSILTSHRLADVAEVAAKAARDADQTLRLSQKEVEARRQKLMELAYGKAGSYVG